VGQFGVSEVDCFTEPSAVAPDTGVDCFTEPSAVAPDTGVDCFTEPSSFARLRRADNEMKHAKHKGFCGMFLRSAVAPDTGVNFLIKQDARQRKLDKLYAAPVQKMSFP